MALTRKHIHRLAHILYLGRKQEMESKTFLANLNQYNCIPFSVFKLNFLLQGTVRNKAKYLKRKCIARNFTSFHTYLTASLSQLVSLKMLTIFTYQSPALLCGDRFLLDTLHQLSTWRNNFFPPHAADTCHYFPSLNTALIYLLRKETFQNNKQHKLFSQFQSSHINHTQADKLLMTNALSKRNTLLKV